MKIIVLDGYTENPGDLSWEPFAALGELTVYDRTPRELVGERMGGGEIAIINKTPMGRDEIQACPNLKYIGLLATGYNIVDLEAASERGILVCNVPSYSTAAVAQYTMALLLEIYCHVGLHSRLVHEGRWQDGKDWCFWAEPLTELAGKTMGIVGFGRIGQETARLAAAFGMQVLACGRRPFSSPLARQVSLEELLAQSDVVPLHCPPTEETQGLINAAAIEKMKQGAVLLNTARGPLVEEQALADALNSGKLRAAGVDVVSREPILPENPLLTAKNCYITPHIAWAARETRQRLLEAAAENLRCFLAGSPIHVVNR